MNTVGTRAAAIAAAGLVAITAACGGGGGGGGDRLSKSEYESKLKAEGTHLKAAFSGVDLQGANVNELETKLTKLQEELDQSASDIEDLKPPENAEAANQKLANVLHRAADKFGELKEAAKAQDLPRLQQLSQQVGVVLQDGQAAAKELKSKGYDIGTLGEG
jgi:chromosome segregation ATPase